MLVWISLLICLHIECDYLLSVCYLPHHYMCVVCDLTLAICIPESPHSWGCGPEVLLYVLIFWTIRGARVERGKKRRKKVIKREAIAQHTDYSCSWFFSGLLMSDLAVEYYIFLEDVFRVEYLPVRTPIAVVWTAHRLSSTGEPDLNFREQGNSCTNTKLVHIYMKLEMWNLEYVSCKYTGVIWYLIWLSVSFITDSVAVLGFPLLLFFVYGCWFKSYANCYIVVARTGNCWWFTICLNIVIWRIQTKIDKTLS